MKCHQQQQVLLSGSWYVYLGCKTI